MSFKVKYSTKYKRPKQPNINKYILDHKQLLTKKTGKAYYNNFVTFAQLEVDNDIF